MTKAFAVCFIISLIFMWVILSTEHGNTVGKELKKIFKSFMKGSKKN